MAADPMEMFTVLRKAKEMSETKSTELALVKFVNSIQAGGLSTNQLRQAADMRLTLVDGFVRVKSSKGTLLVPLTNVAYMAPCDAVKVEKAELKK